MKTKDLSLALAFKFITLSENNPEDLVYDVDAFFDEFGVTDKSDMAFAAIKHGTFKYSGLSDNELFEKFEEEFPEIYQKYLRKNKLKRITE